MSIRASKCTLLQRTFYQIKGGKQHETNSNPLHIFPWGLYSSPHSKRESGQMLISLLYKHFLFRSVNDFPHYNAMEGRQPYKRDASSTGALELCNHGKHLFMQFRLLCTDYLYSNKQPLLHNSKTLLSKDSSFYGMLRILNSRYCLRITDTSAV